MPVSEELSNFHHSESSLDEVSSLVEKKYFVEAELQPSFTEGHNCMEDTMKIKTNTGTDRTNGSTMTVSEESGDFIHSKMS